MESDFVFRKARFSGFNRDDVIDYIEKLKLWELSLADEVNERKASLEKLQTRYDELESKLGTIEVEHEKEIEELNDKHSMEIAALEESHKAEIEEIKAEYDKKMNEINNSAEAKPSNNKNLEEQIGAAMLDVRRYADMLISEAERKVDSISEKADESAAKTLTRVLDISSGIQTFSDKLNSIFSDVLNDNDNICHQLADFNGSVKKSFVESVKALEDKNTEE